MLDCVEQGLKLGFDDRDEGLTTVSEILRTLEYGDRPAPWRSYWAITSAGAAVGLCAFKRAPGTSRETEIAYFTFPACQNRGFAIEMVQGLTAIALGAGAAGITARTLPSHGASTNVLRKAGFAWSGSVEDEEDGIVWEWRLPLDQSPSGISTGPTISR